MNPLPENEAQALQQNWQRTNSGNLTSVFEFFGENRKENTRITGRDFGLISDDFLSQLHAFDTSGLDSLSLCLGLDKNDNMVQVFWKLKVGGNTYYYAGEANMSQTFVSHTVNPTQPHLGVSVNYKNEVCTNWATLPYYQMNDIFFAVEQKPDVDVKGDELFLSRPVKVLKFIIPTGDIEILKATAAPGKSIKVHYGVNFGNSTRYIIDFVPVIQVYTAQDGPEALFEEDDPDSTYFDFIHPCPPVCPD